MLTASSIRSWCVVLCISIRALDPFPSKDPSNKRALLHFLINIRGLPILFLIIHVNKAGMSFKTLLVLVGIRFTLSSPLLAGRGDAALLEDYTREGLEAEFKGK